ncbi:hypothetical protein BDF22DRAFT_741385 [Syncephalis plumigaleata]|nr:hypothetical protein BDF22DRAFT_741385 [Syncephalis plumigaleata]
MSNPSSSVSSTLGFTDNGQTSSLLPQLSSNYTRQHSRSPSSSSALRRRASWHDTAPERHTHHASIMHHLNSNEWRQQFLQQCLQRLHHKRDDIINDYRGLHESMEIDDDSYESMPPPSASQSLVVRSTIDSQLQDWLNSQSTTASNDQSSMMDTTNSFDKDDFSKNMERDIYRQMWTEYRNTRLI